MKGQGMKFYNKIGMLFAVVIVGMFVWGIVLGTVYSPDKIPFLYDPNQIVGEKLGGVSIEAADVMIVDINCTDPQDDPFVITIEDAPLGMFIINDNGNWRLQWTPDVLQVGIWYVVLKATDSPPPPQKAKSSQGTIVIQVVGANEAPVLWPLEDSLEVVYVSPQKRWQELRKQGTILVGPVSMDLLR